MSSRHRFGAMVGILVLLLAACGPAATPTAAPQPTATQPPATPAPGIATATPTRAAPTTTPTQAPSATAPKIGGTLKMQDSDGLTWDPHAQLAAGLTDTYHIFDPLVRLDFDLRPIPSLAESWDAPDATTLVFKLRKGVTFHDGSPFNAQVAKWNFDRMLDPGTIAPVPKQSLLALDKAEVVDDYTLRLTLKRPDSALLFNLGTSHFSMMTPPAVGKWGRDVGLHPVGTGPFVLEALFPGRGMKLTRNASYWDSPRPYVGVIDMVITSDPSVIMASLLTGALDLSGVTLPEHLDRLEKDPGMTIHSAPGIVTWGLYFNHLKAPMNNLDFRKALNLAADREGMLKALLRGRGDVANSLVSTAFAEHNNGLPGITRNVAEAKTLVARSGYDGRTLDFGCWPGIATAPKVCEAMQAQFKEIGVNSQITMHAGAAYGPALGELKYDIAVMYSPHIPIDTRINIFYHRQGRLNSGRFGDTPLARQLEKIMEDISITYDFNTRKRLFDELQQVAYDNMVDLYIMYQPEVLVSRARVQDFKVHPGTLEWLSGVWLKD
ncbi:MAG: ABC transporter substrate-binding protein [Chloroflexi bacterium]|nr:ABC transporter substrate-binding protein [Chloroflexota bacterium]